MSSYDTKGIGSKTVCGKYIWTERAGIHRLSQKSPLKNSQSHPYFIGAILEGKNPEHLRHGG